MKILIIDDNPADRTFYRKNIEDCQLFKDVEVRECSSLGQGPAADARRRGRYSMDQASSIRPAFWNNVIRGR